ncbi:MAG TPA: glutamine-hydrolyzing carbamoyl-phosphate synthase small subunit, partial [Streptosporangiaceae bacterium]
NDEDRESGRIWVSGYVVREPARVASSWRSTRGLDEELRAQGITAIAITGTRALTRHLRERGAMRAAISTRTRDPRRLREKVLASPPMTGADLAREVSTARPYTVRPPGGQPVRYRVSALDLGIKAATPAALARLGCEVTVLPAASTGEQLLAGRPDGVFFSNGPGDPAAAGYAADAMREVIGAGLPVFGICLGSQILGRALGLDTYKLRFGHRGVNHPVKDLRTGRVLITSHNHGFAVAMPADRGFRTPFGPAEVSHVDLNDGVVEGIALAGRPVFGVQFHPEAAPGPRDAAGLFGRFCELMERSGA